MKIAFALLVLTVVAVSAKSIKFSRKEIAKSCHEKCKSSEEQKLRINNYMMEHTPIDRCYVECGWKAVGQMKDDGNLDMEKIYAQFADHGLEIPPGTEKLANTNGDMDLLIDRTMEWSNNHRDIIHKAYFFEPL